MSGEVPDLVHVGEGEKPEAVAEAERTVRRLGLTLAGTGAGAVLLWLIQAFAVVPLLIPLAWVGLFLVGLVLFFFFPQTRKARLAREVLRQWDGVQVRGLLETSGTTTDPRLEAAERMGERILRHPGATDEMRRLSTDLVAALRQTTRDQRIVEVLLGSRDQTSGDAAFVGSLRDSLDYLEARAGRLLGGLADLHSAVVRRDGGQVAKVLREASEILGELEAQAEIDRLLGDGRG